MKTREILLITTISALAVGIILSFIYNSIFLFLFLPFGFGWGYSRKTHERKLTEEEQREKVHEDDHLTN